jgi:hypothetical protein
MNSNKIISREVVIFDIPPDESILKTYNMEKLLNECKRLNIPREQYEADNDEDKNKRFIISEILRLEPPLPIHQKPILLLSDYDETTMTKINTYKYVKHIIIDNIYKESIITIESYKLPLTKRELDIQNKEFLMNSIYNEINIINIDDYKTKDDILKFACENGKSSGEKYLRASILNKLVIENMKNNKKFIRPRITHYDISVY